jgi:hypothetical protein
VANDFASIGFKVESGPEFAALLSENATRWPQIKTPVGGSYVRAGKSDGAEFWIQLSPTGELLGGHPHFSGTSRFNAVIDRPTQIGAEGTPLDGSVFCHMVDDVAGVPLMVDVPDFVMDAAWQLPGTKVVLQLAAFPRSVQVWADEAEHASSPMGKMASQSLIPSGLFKPGGGEVDKPRNDVILAGRVEACREITNGMSGLPFYGLSVRTLGGVIDVPLSMGSVKAAPSVGAIIGGSFTLSGRVVEPRARPELIEAWVRKGGGAKGAGPQAGKKSWLRRLLRG